MSYTPPASTYRLPKRYFSGYIAASGTTDSSSTAAGSNGSVITTIFICNTNTAAQTVNISVGASAATGYSATTAIYSAFSIPASGVHVANLEIVLNSGDKIWMNTPTGSKVVATISGYDL